jgi:Ser/Thr protein kinase RdoA (MazF antagonist)
VPVAHSVIEASFLAGEVGRRYALRVWRRDWREVDAVGFELESPEGPRAVALYDWAPGRKFGDCLGEPTAEKIGAAFARLRLLGLEWNGGRALPTERLTEFNVNMPALLEFCYDRPDDLLP